MSDFLAIGNDELGDPVGESIDCPRCGKSHPIEYGTSKTRQPDGRWSKPKPSKLLGFYKCGDKLYVASLNGRKLKEPPR